MSSLTQISHFWLFILFLLLFFGRSGNPVYNFTLSYLVLYFWNFHWYISILLRACVCACVCVWVRVYVFLCMCMCGLNCWTIKNNWVWLELCRNPNSHNIIFESFLTIFFVKRVCPYQLITIPGRQKRKFFWQFFFGWVTKDEAKKIYLAFFWLKKIGSERREDDMQQDCALSIVTWWEKKLSSECKRERERENVCVRMCFKSF